MTGENIPQRTCATCFALIPLESEKCPKCSSIHLQKTTNGETTVHNLQHISEIENPELAGCPISVDAVVSSTSVSYSVPSRIKVNYEDNDGVEQDYDIDIDASHPANIKLVGINEDVKYKRLKRLTDGHRKVTVHEVKWRTVYWIRVRPPVYTLEKRGEKILDERGFEYKSFDVYITSDRQITFPPGSLIHIEGFVLSHPKTQKITILAYDVSFPESVASFDMAKLQRLHKVFTPLSVDKRVRWILENFERYSKIIGRRNLAFSYLLTSFTPIWVIFDGDIQKGWGNTTIIGDTTTAKSETVRKMIRLLKAGMIVTAELATAVGLLGSAVQIGDQGWFVEWGLLVLCDGKILAIDGAHKLSAKQWSVLSEAERNGNVTISKAGKGTAYARTRQVKIANAVDLGSKTYSTKRMGSFLYPCQALATFLDKTNIARLDQAVFANEEDVEVEKINVRFTDKHEPELEFLSEALRWCWSNTAEVNFTEEAMSLLLKEATRLYRIYFCGNVPLVSIDFKWKLARLSIAMASLTLSTEDFKTVTVTEEHVREITKFLENEYMQNGLNTLAQATRHEVMTLEAVNMVIEKVTSAMKGEVTRDMVIKIISFIANEGRVTRDQLKARFDLTENNQTRPLLAVLSNEKFIRLGRGIYPNTPLIQAYKLLNSNFNKINMVNNLKKEPPQVKKREIFSDRDGDGPLCGTCEYLHDEVECFRPGARGISSTAPACDKYKRRETSDIHTLYIVAKRKFLHTEFIKHDYESFCLNLGYPANIIEGLRIRLLKGGEITPTEAGLYRWN